jgi:hypothetical protein
VADNGSWDVGQPALLDPIQEAEAEAELGITVNLDGTVSAATSSPAPALLP